jgi:hypothetical protein
LASCLRQQSNSPCVTGRRSIAATGSLIPTSRASCVIAAGREIRSACQSWSPQTQGTSSLPLLRYFLVNCSLSLGPLC